MLENVDVLHSYLTEFKLKLLQLLKTQDTANEFIDYRNNLRHRMEYMKAFYVYKKSLGQSEDEIRKAFEYYDEEGYEYNNDIKPYSFLIRDETYNPITNDELSSLLYFDYLKEL